MELILTRQEIETKWLHTVGKPLCLFTSNVGLRGEWDKVWASARYDHDLLYINCAFAGDRHVQDLTYLTRALSLNMLLDDNEVV